LDPSGPWSKLTLAIAYATEAHLFITDLNQSPFNVGTRIILEDFTLEQITELNHRYGDPLRDQKELISFIALLGGQPYLTRRAFHELVTRDSSYDVFETAAEREEGIFGDHLRRILLSLRKDANLIQSVNWCSDRPAVSGGKLLSAAERWGVGGGQRERGQTALPIVQQLPQATFVNWPRTRLSA
jgi:hypothetical protein